MLKEIKRLCQTYNFFPKKSAGQNFLIDSNLLKKIVQEARLAKNDLVLEVGPGFGFLTRELAKKAKKVLAIEIDKRLCQILQKELANFSNIEILEGDILKISFSQIAKWTEGKDYKIVANLPYNITSNFLRKFLENEPRPKEMLLMVQKEVAERICAKASQGMSLLSLMVQFYAEPQILFFIPSSVFWPEPEVESALLKIEVLPKKLSREREKKFFWLARIGFSSRRKQLQNNLKAGLRWPREKIKELLQQANLNPLARAEDLSVADWLRLFEKFESELSKESFNKQS